jgi:3D (Asp-Asp-Asp) domain-containing protein
VSADTLGHPWMLPVRLVLPWLWFPRDGTVAADTAYYPFGTRLYIPGYGYGVVEDRGSAIKGPRRLDVYYRWHHEAREFGRRTELVEILR